MRNQYNMTDDDVRKNKSMWGLIVEYENDLNKIGYDLKKDSPIDLLNMVVNIQINDRD